MQEFLKKSENLSKDEVSKPSAFKLIKYIRRTLAELYFVESNFQKSLNQYQIIISNEGLSDEEKYEIQDHIVKNLDNIYDCKNNEFFKEENSKTINYIINEGMEEYPDGSSILKLSDVSDYLYYKLYVQKKELYSEENNLIKLKEYLVDEFKKKGRENNINIKDIKEISYLIDDENDELIRLVLNSILNLKRDNTLQFVGFIPGMKIILENPFITKLGIPDATEILKYLIEHLTSLYRPTNSIDKEEFFQLISIISKILDLISDMNTKENQIYINKELYKNIKQEFESDSLKNKIKGYSLIEFQLNYAKQSLLRISNGETVFDEITNRFTHIGAVFENLAKVYYSKNPAYIINAFHNFKEAIIFSIKENWVDDCRRIEKLLKNKKLHYLESEVNKRLEESDVKSEYFFYLIIQLRHEYEKLIDYFYMFKVNDKNCESIKKHHEQIINFFIKLLKKLIEILSKEDEKKKLIYLISNTFDFLESNLEHYCEELNKIYKFENKIDSNDVTYLNENSIKTIQEENFKKKLFDTAKILIKFINDKREELKNTEEVKEIFKKINEKSTIKKLKDYEFQKISVLFEKKELSWELKVYNHQQKRLTCKQENDFLIEKEKLYVKQKYSKERFSENKEDIFKYITDDFLKNDKKVILLVGVSGVGKSTFTQYLEIQLLKQNYNDYKPMWVNLNTLKNPMEYLIEEFFNKMNVDVVDLNSIKRKKILFILDGFDEINDMRNIYNKNKFSIFENSKILISCREEYFERINILYNYTHIFGPGGSHEKLALIYLREFDESDKDQFLRNLVELNISKGINIWSLEDYKKKLKYIDESSEYTSNAFNLHLLCKALPSLENSNKITRFHIYEKFIIEWFNKEFIKINNYLNLDLEKIFSSSDKESRINDLYQFSEGLAIALFTYSCSSINTGNKYNCIRDDNDDLNPFKIFFEKNKKCSIFRRSAPLKRLSDNDYNFIHKSIMEYLVSKSIIERLKEIEKIKIEDLLKSKIDKMKNDFILNKFNLSEQPAILLFISDYLNFDNQLIKTLREIINLSKENSNIEYLSSNCASLLNYSFKNLTNQDFSNTNLPYTDFRSAVLVNSDFSNCNLKYAQFSNSNISYCKFEKTDLSRATTGKTEKKIDKNIKDVNFTSNKFFILTTPNSLMIYTNELDFKNILEIEDIEYFEFSNNCKYLYVITKNKSIKIYYINNEISLTDIDQTKNLIELKKEIKNIKREKFVNEKKFLLILLENTIIDYDTNSFNEIRRIENIYAIDFEISNNYFTIMQENSIQIFEINSQREFNKKNNIQYESVKFSHNERYFVFNSKDSIFVYNDFNLKNFHYQRSFKNNHVKSFEFSLDDKYLIIFTQDGSINLFDVEVEEHFKIIELGKDIDQSIVNSYLFTEDNNHLIVALKNNKILIYKFIDKEEIIIERKEIGHKLIECKQISDYFLILNNNNNLLICDANSKSIIVELKIHNHESCDLINNRYLVILTNTKHLEIYNVKENFKRIFTKQVSDFELFEYISDKKFISLKGINRKNSIIIITPDDSIIFLEEYIFDISINDNILICSKNKLTIIYFDFEIKEKKINSFLSLKCLYDTENFIIENEILSSNTEPYLSYQILSEDKQRRKDEVILITTDDSIIIFDMKNKNKIYLEIIRQNLKWIKFEKYNKKLFLLVFRNNLEIYDFEEKKNIIEQLYDKSFFFIQIQKYLVIYDEKKICVLGCNNKFNLLKKFHNIILKSITDEFLIGKNNDHNLIIYSVEDGFNEIFRLEEYDDPGHSVHFSKGKNLLVVLSNKKNKTCKDGKIYLRIYKLEKTILTKPMQIKTNIPNDHSSHFVRITSDNKYILLLKDKNSPQIKEAFSIENRYPRVNLQEVNLDNYLDQFRKDKPSSYRFKEYQFLSSDLNIQKSKFFLSEHIHNIEWSESNVYNKLNELELSESSLKKFKDLYENFELGIISNDNNYFATLNKKKENNLISIYDFNKDNETSIKIHRDDIYIIKMIRFSKDNKYIIISLRDNEIIILTNGFKEIRKIDNVESVTVMEFSDDNKYFVYCTKDKSTIITDIENNFQKFQEIAKTENVESFKFINHTRFLLISRNNKDKNNVYFLVIFDMVNKREVFRRMEDLKFYKFSNENKYLGILTQNNTIIIHDCLMNFEKIKEIKTDKDSEYFDFSNDNKNLVIISKENTIIMYDIEISYKKLKVKEIEKYDIISIGDKYYLLTLTNYKEYKHLENYELLNDEFLKIDEFKNVSFFHVIFNYKILVISYKDKTLDLKKINRGFEIIEKIKDIEEDLIKFCDNYLMINRVNETMIYYKNNDKIISKKTFGNCHSLMFSSDNKHILSLDEQSSIKIYDVINNFTQKDINFPNIDSIDLDHNKNLLKNNYQKDDYLSINNSIEVINKYTHDFNQLNRKILKLEKKKKKTIIDFQIINDNLLLIEFKYQSKLYDIKVNPVKTLFFKKRRDELFIGPDENEYEEEMNFLCKNLYLIVKTKTNSIELYDIHKDIKLNLEEKYSSYSLFNENKYLILRNKDVLKLINFEENSKENFKEILSEKLIDTYKIIFSNNFKFLLVFKDNYSFLIHDVTNNSNNNKPLDIKIDFNKSKTDLLHIEPYPENDENSDYAKHSKSSEKSLIDFKDYIVDFDSSINDENLQIPMNEEKKEQGYLLEYELDNSAQKYLLSQKFINNSNYFVLSINSNSNKTIIYDVKNKFLILIEINENLDISLLEIINDRERDILIIGTNNNLIFLYDRIESNIRLRKKIENVKSINLINQNKYLIVSTKDQRIKIYNLFDKFKEFNLPFLQTKLNFNCKTRYDLYCDFKKYEDNQDFLYSLNRKDVTKNVYPDVYPDVYYPGLIQNNNYPLISCFKSRSRKDVFENVYPDVYYPKLIQNEKYPTFYYQIEFVSKLNIFIIKEKSQQNILFCNSNFEKTLIEEENIELIKFDDDWKHLIILYKDYCVRIYSINQEVNQEYIKFEIKKEIKPIINPIRDLKFSNQNKYFIVSDNESILIYDVNKNFQVIFVSNNISFGLNINNFQLRNEPGKISDGFKILMKNE